MVCAGLESLTDKGIVGILQYPTSCDFWFWGKIMLAIFMILTLSLYIKDREKLLKADFISAAGVSALATIFLTLIGSIAQIIERDIMVLTLVIGLIFIIMWLIKR